MSEVIPTRLKSYLIFPLFFLRSLQHRQHRREYSTIPGNLRYLICELFIIELHARKIYQLILLFNNMQ